MTADVAYCRVLRRCFAREAALMVAAFAAIAAVAPAIAATPSLNAPESIAAPDLSFRLDEGRNLNSFVRAGPVAAHLVLRSGTEPRILVAFPAGNSGTGLWFAKTQKPVRWALTASPQPVTIEDEKGRALHGIEAEIRVDTGVLRIERAVLSSVRVLRDYEIQRTAPPEISAPAVVSGQQISWSRDRLDGAPGYRLSLQVPGDAEVASEAIRGKGDSLRLRLLAVTGERPLTPLGGATLLSPAAGPDARERNVLAFLSYGEKFLAGSWRFDTYFGRDTLMSVMLLGPALQPPAVKTGAISVLERLAPDGEVAHEEEIGEFAILRNMQEGRGRSDTPRYDYGMVDDDFMLAPLAARWLLDTPAARARAHLALATRIAGGERVGDALVRNFVWVITRTAAFAREPVATNLVSIKPGRNTGDWRDSEDGLGHGRFAYDINVALVPAALAAVDRLTRSGLLDPYASPEQQLALLHAGKHLAVWSDKAAPLFRVSVPAERAQKEISAYATSLGMDSATALAAVKGGPVVFDALSLDERGAPVPVMHSDEGFVLFFGDPDAERLERAIATVTRPFPAGLLTPIGMLVANPVFAGADLQARFTNAAYHGTVVWSWQQALMAAGMDRQLARDDLSPDLRAHLKAARARLWQAIDGAGNLRSSELWSWAFAKGCYRAEAFGQRRADADESNAAQLWSTVFLALVPPRAAESSGPLAAARCRP